MPGIVNAFEDQNYYKEKPRKKKNDKKRVKE